VFGGGLACLLGALVFARRLPVLRQKAHSVYAGMGIVPEIAKGIESANEPRVAGDHPDK